MVGYLILSQKIGIRFPVGAPFLESTAMKLIDEIKDKNVHFKYYRDGDLWYETENGFLFPVPISDIGTATFLATDKAILFMRYIRKWKEKLAKPYFFVVDGKEIM